MVSDSISARTIRPGSSADVGPTVATDLGFVADAAEGDADEFAAQGSSDRLAQRGLADARGSDQQQDGALAAGCRRSPDPVLAQLADRQVFDDSFFDVVEAGVVGVEHRPGLIEVEAIL